MGSGSPPARGWAILIPKILRYSFIQAQCRQAHRGQTHHREAQCRQAQSRLCSGPTLSLRHAQVIEKRLDPSLRWDKGGRQDDDFESSIFLGKKLGFLVTLLIWSVIIPRCVGSILRFVFWGILVCTAGSCFNWLNIEALYLQQKRPWCIGGWASSILWFDGNSGFGS